MASSGASPQWYRQGRPRGKVTRRVQDVRMSSSGFDFWTGRAPLDLSHNEGARLAADGLLCLGLEGYHAALKTQGEVDFLSEQEKKYFLENGKGGHADTESGDGEGKGSDVESESSSSSSHTVTPGPSESKDRDSEDATEAALSYKEDEDGSVESRGSSVEAFFNTEKKAAGLKDAVREFIRKAQKSLEIVTDSFSDVELLCDLLEASKKRFVSVHLLLDHLNLDIFRDMWHELKLQGKDFPKFSVHSVEGEAFCSRTGRKLNGQISETFIITDGTEALTGSFSFSWLSWLVHRHLAFLVKGGAVTHFLQEFHRLCSSSAPVPGFTLLPFTVNDKTKSRKTQPKAKTTAEPTDENRIWDWMEDGLKSRTKERTQTNVQFTRPLRQPVMQHSCMDKFMKPTLGGVAAQDRGNVLHKAHTPRKPQYPTLVPYSHPHGTTGKNVTAHSNSCLLAAQKKDLNQDQQVVHEEFWRQKRIVMAPPGIAAGINKLREERSTPKNKPSSAPNSKGMPCFMSQEKSEKQCVQAPLNTAGKSNERRHHFLQSPTKPESGLSPVKGAQEPKAPPPSRLTWMTQSNAARTGRTRPVSFYCYDSVQKVNGQWQVQSNNASAKPLERSRSITEKPAARINQR